MQIRKSAGQVYVPVDVRRADQICKQTALDELARVLRLQREAAKEAEQAAALLREIRQRECEWWKRRRRRLDAYGVRRRDEEVAGEAGGDFNDDFNDDFF